MEKVGREKKTARLGLPEGISGDGLMQEIILREKKEEDRKSQPWEKRQARISE